MKHGRDVADHPHQYFDFGTGMCNEEYLILGIHVSDPSILGEDLNRLCQETHVVRSIDLVVLGRQTTLVWQVPQLVLQDPLAQLP